MIAFALGFALVFALLSAFSPSFKKKAERGRGTLGPKAFSVAPKPARNVVAGTRSLTLNLAPRGRRLRLL
jgi:hypothetical protein